LIAITRAQTGKLQARLMQAQSTTKVYCGMKHSTPFINEALIQASEDGIDDLLVIPLTPHYSMMNTETYVLSVEMANNTLERKLDLDYVKSWNSNQRLLQAWAKRVRDAQTRLPPDCELIFSAHSLPERTLGQGDVYRSRLLETSASVASLVGKDPWSFAFQSAGHTGEPWLGPDILQHLQSSFEAGQRCFLLAPVGFVSDHLEILYDIDVECRGWARTRGARLERCQMLNDSDDFIDCLYSIVEERGFAA
jgi:ferrochelatase